MRCAVQALALLKLERTLTEVPIFISLRIGTSRTYSTAGIDCSMPNLLMFIPCLKVLKAGHLSCARRRRPVTPIFFVYISSPVSLLLVHQLQPSSHFISHNGQQNILRHLCSRTFTHAGCPRPASASGTPVRCVYDVFGSRGLYSP